MLEIDNWISITPFPPLRREAHFGNRVVKCYTNRPNDCTVLLSESVQRCPHKEAVVCDNVRITYSQLDQLTNTVCVSLRKAGVEAGDRVALLMENSAEYVVYIFAILKLGAISVPLNIKESKRGIEYILRDAQVKCLVCHSSLEDLIPEEGFLDELISVILLKGFEDLQMHIDSQDQTIIFPRIDSEHTAFLIYTSGTTGTPKGATITHLNVLHSVINYQAAMTLGEDDRSIVAVPISHITGLVALVLTAIGASASLIVMKSFNADAFVDLAQNERITHTLLVPAMFNLILMSKKLQFNDLSLWRVSGYGGSIMPETTLTRIAKNLPNLNIYNCYGATETTSPAAIMPPAYAETRPSQVGLPVPCADIFIADRHGCQLPSGELGEIWIAGPMVIPGYWNNAEANAAEFFGGYWKSGDVGWIDESGFLAVVDRIKYVINRGGYKIYASEVEGTLLEHKDVLDCAVVAFNCSVLGERVAAFICGTADFNAEEVKDFCADRLAEYKVPEEIVAIDHMPRNANGKIVKRELKELANERFER
ncbi:O-succinylbenzoic acid--CoA ligase [Kineobactrum sediminis]|uniref:O-succinylbenzoic acid--CoA ligase n=1 Tax=Kineobactrum sediminis TaxID=1905677 RepID=A0A2N5Y0Y6_9GAMM|nr:class I adenylate-forming enzyme family protein [Kineobactrum sediminis]PLW82056.1 O-succinylbenzoic acid--CoA ligase [Kineobactrum sediminis]